MPLNDEEIAFHRELFGDSVFAIQRGYLHAIMEMTDLVPPGRRIGVAENFDAHHAYWIDGLTVGVP